MHIKICGHNLGMYIFFIVLQIFLKLFLHKKICKKCVLLKNKRMCKAEAKLNEMLKMTCTHKDNIKTKLRSNLQTISRKKVFHIFLFTYHFSKAYSNNNTSKLFFLAVSILLYKSFPYPCLFSEINDTAYIIKLKHSSFLYTLLFGPAC